MKIGIDIGGSHIAIALVNGQGKIIDKIDEKIKEARTNILNAKFDINPKIIDGVNVSCKLCKFKDICYVKDKDKINLGKDKDLDYLKTKIN